MVGVMRAIRDRAGVDRLTGPELTGFVPEARGWPADIGVIAILDGAGLFDGDGRLRITDVRDAIASRLHQAPRLRQVVYRPGPGLGRPLWLDVRRFDIADHVHVRALRATADHAGLLQACEELRQHRLDPWPVLGHTLPTRPRRLPVLAAPGMRPGNPLRSSGYAAPA